MDEREKFLEAADKFGALDGVFAAHSAEPWPEWFTNVAFRMARIIAPGLKKEDVKERPEYFEGQAAALLSPLIKAAQGINLDELPDHPVLNIVKQGLLSVRTQGLADYQEVLSAASQLPAEESASFFGAYGDGLKKDASGYGLERFGDSNTAVICLFLLFMRPLIDGRKVRTVTELFDLFMQVHEIVPSEKEYFAKNPLVRKSLEAQFRKICSQDKVKLAGKGRPRKNRTGKGKRK